MCRHLIARLSTRARGPARRAATLLVAAAALALGPVTVSSTPVAAALACPAGTNWDAVLKACVQSGPMTAPAP